MSRITTIIPTYRRPKLLRRAISSVLEQSYPHFQVCVYDNASGDETAHVVREYSKRDSRVRYFCHEENIGGEANFTYAVERVDTPFFTMLSDDDFLLPDFYKITLEGFEKHPESIFSAAATVHISDSGKMLDVPMSRWIPGFYNPPDGLVAMLKYGHPTWTGILFRKEILQKVGFVRRNVGVTSDLDFELRVAQNYPFVVSQKSGAVFVMHSGGSYVSAGLSGFWPGWMRMIRAFAKEKDLPKNIRSYVKNNLRQRLYVHLFRISVRKSLEGNYKEAQKTLGVIFDEYGMSLRNCILCFGIKTMKYLPFMRIAGNKLKKARERIFCSKNHVFLDDFYKKDVFLIKKIMLDK